MVNEPPKPKTLREEMVGVLAVLVQELPAALPIKLRIAPLKDCFGCCDMRQTKRDGSHFLITLAKGMEPVQAADTLLHEYAHCLAWFSSGEDHGPEWGVAFSRCYKAFCDP